MCTDLIVYSVCPLCQQTTAKQIIYQRACEDIVRFARTVTDCITNHGACAHGIWQEKRTKIAHEPCGFCRWQLWLQARQNLIGKDFWSIENRA